MRQQIINGQPVQVADAIKDFVICQKESSNVAFFGHGPFSDIFVQFKNGAAYIYKNTDAQLVKDMLAAESIGKFIPRLKGLETVKQPGKLVEPVKEQAASE